MLRLGQMNQPCPTMIIVFHYCSALPSPGTGSTQAFVFSHGCFYHRQSGDERLPPTYHAHDHLREEQASCLAGLPKTVYDQLRAGFLGISVFPNCYQCSYTARVQGR